MAKFEKKIEAHNLRRKGLSINIIAKKLGISKSSASVWCRDITLTKAQQEKLIKNSVKAGLKGRLMGAAINRQKKQSAIEHYHRAGEKRISYLSKNERLLLGVALYWAEGSKGSKLSFVNSDPQMILFMYRWFQESLGVKKEEFIVRVFINEMHTPRISVVVAFWKNLLNLSEDQFRSTIFIKTKQRKVYENYDTYYGMLALRIRCSTNLLYKIEGLINAIKKINT